MAVIVTKPPPIVPPEEIVRSVEIPARRTTYIHGGKLTIVDHQPQKICYDKTNRKVLCVESVIVPALEPAPAIPAPEPTKPPPKQTHQSGPNQYNMQNEPPPRSVYE